jgi:catechol 2,3-dioxygenase-like lactoylglutathione lyase family enzyme
VKFYEETLGLRLLFRVPGMAFLDCNGIRIMLGIPENPTLDHPGSTVYFSVEDIQASYEILVSRQRAKK